MITRGWAAQARCQSSQNAFIERLLNAVVDIGETPLYEGRRDDDPTAALVLVHGHVYWS